MPHCATQTPLDNSGFVMHWCLQLMGFMRCMVEDEWTHRMDITWTSQEREQALHGGLMYEAWANERGQCMGCRA